MNKLDEFKEVLDKIGGLRYTVSILRWEMDTIAPKTSFDYLIDVSSKYEAEAFKISTSDDYINKLRNVINSDEFNQHYNSMKFTDDKQAFMQGLIWAALLTVRIPHYYLKGDK